MNRWGAPFLAHNPKPQSEVCSADCALAYAAVTLCGRYLLEVQVVENEASKTSPADSGRQVMAVTQRWVKRFVVDLGLCPFAQHVTPYIAVSWAVSEQTLLAALGQELEALIADDRRETTLLVHPKLLNDFLDYNNFLSSCDELLVAAGLEGVIQVASFHPDYQFAGTVTDAPENFANRSPYPMLHLLREDDVTRAVDEHPNVEQIVSRNAEVLEGLGASELHTRRLGCFSA